MNCAGNLLCLFQFNPDSRRKLLDVLEFIFIDIAAWAMPASRRKARPAYIANCENGDLESWIVDGQFLSHFSLVKLLLFGESIKCMMITIILIECMI